METLPVEVITVIFSYLDIRSKLKLKTCSSYFLECFNNSESWKDIYKIHCDFGNYIIFNSYNGPEYKIRLFSQNYSPYKSILPDIFSLCRNVSELKIEDEEFKRDDEVTISLIKSFNFKYVKSFSYKSTWYLLDKIDSNNIFVDIFCKNLEILNVDIFTLTTVHRKLLCENIEKCINIKELEIGWKLPPIDLSKLPKLQVLKVYTHSLSEINHEVQTIHLRDVPYNGIPGRNKLNLKTNCLLIDHRVNSINIHIFVDILQRSEVDMIKIKEISLSNVFKLIEYVNKVRILTNIDMDFNIDFLKEEIDGYNKYYIIESNDPLYSYELKQS